MPQYLLSIIQPTTGTLPPEQLEPIMRDVRAFDEELRASGSWVFNGGLAGPETATVVRVADEEVLLTDGPFAEAKEAIGGLVIVESPDLDAALAWGRKAAAATTLPVEVRPFRW